MTYRMSKSRENVVLSHLDQSPGYRMNPSLAFHKTMYDEMLSFHSHSVCTWHTIQFVIKHQLIF